MHRWQFNYADAIMESGYFIARLKFILKNYPKRLIRVVTWPIYGFRHWLNFSAHKHNMLLLQFAGYWLGWFFLVIDLFLLGDGFDLVAMLFKRTRALNSNEKAAAASVFANSIDLDLVRLDERARLGCKQLRIAYVSLFTINSWGPVNEYLLIHELTHVWQYQRMGLAYIPLALLAQLSPEGYNYNGIAGLRSARSSGLALTSFNLEQQAEIVSDFYLAKKSLSFNKPTFSDDGFVELEHFGSQIAKG